MTRGCACLLVAAGLSLAPDGQARAQSEPPLRLPGSSLPRRAPAPEPAPPRQTARPRPAAPGSALPPAAVRTAAPPPPAAAARAPLDAAPADGLSIARQLGLQVSRIVIDAGHGGRDPGAHANDLREAEVVLDIARRVAERLQAQPGVEVVMTRTDDTFVPLRARTALANEVGADLFLSIHANASRNAGAHGVETYFLDFALDPEAERIAARENLAADGKMTDLENILDAIAANSKLQESRDFAGTIQRALVAALRAVNGEVRDLGVKQAPFFVLIGARMPSVLAEVSFLSNRREAKLLATGAYRQRIADALAEGVLHYRQRLGRSPRATQQD